MNPPKLPTTLAPNASALFDTHGTLTVLFITQWMNVMGEISKAEGLSHLAAPVIATLRNLVRDHLLHFRLEVGRGVRAVSAVEVSGLGAASPTPTAASVVVAVSAAAVVPPPASEPQP